MMGGLRRVGVGIGAILGILLSLAVWETPGLAQSNIPGRIILGPSTAVIGHVICDSGCGGGGSGGGTSAVDNSAFVLDTTEFTPGGGVFNDAAAALGAGVAAAFRMTSFRGMHVNLRTAAGVEIAPATSTLQTTGNNSLAELTATISDVGLSTAARVLGIQGTVGGVLVQVQDQIIGSTLSPVGSGSFIAQTVQGDPAGVPIPISGTVATGGLTDAQLRATPVPVSGTVSTSPVTDVNVSGAMTNPGDFLEIVTEGMSTLSGNAVTNDTTSQYQLVGSTDGTNFFYNMQPVFNDTVTGWITTPNIATLSVSTFASAGLTPQFTISTQGMAKIRLIRTSGSTTQTWAIVASVANFGPTGMFIRGSAGSSAAVDVNGGLRVDATNGTLTIQGVVTDPSSATLQRVPLAALFNDAVGALGANVNGALRITSWRGLHVNLRDNSGNEIAPLTDTQLRATPVVISGTVVTGGLTDTQLRATPVPISGTVTTGGLTDTQLRASAVPVSGPVTDAQLRATPVPVSGAVTVTGSVTQINPVAATATSTYVGVAGQETQLLAANGSRKSFRVVNQSTRAMLIKLGTGIGTTSYTSLIPPGQTFSIGLDGPMNYTGAVTGIWFGLDGGGAMITEM